MMFPKAMVLTRLTTTLMTEILMRTVVSDYDDHSSVVGAASMDDE